MNENAPDDCAMAAAARYVTDRRQIIACTCNNAKPRSQRHNF